MTSGIELRKPPTDRLKFLAETVLAKAALQRITDSRVFAVPLLEASAQRLAGLLLPAHSAHAHPQSDDGAGQP